jgi:beta-aspartyl-peptidase (threonine type)
MLVDIAAARHTRSVTFIALLFMVIANSSSEAQSQSATDISSDAKWAIAIHGGAGGDPAKWTDAQKTARQEGITKALQTGRDILAGGGSSMDAVEQVIRILEDDPAFNAGRGAVLTSERNAELDAAIMDGRELQCGAVASVTKVRHPITLARRVMTETRHVLLIGSGADAFAKNQGVELVTPDYFHLGPDESDQSLYRTRDGSYLGTVGCVARDVDGNLAAGTSTGGLSQKMPGRVGDSPIIGAGTYADNATCAISATGVGEEYIRNVIAYDIAARMRYAGTPLAEATAIAIDATLKPDTGGLIAVGQDGEISLAHNTPGMTCAAADSGGRFEVMLRVDRGSDN